MVALWCGMKIQFRVKLYTVRRMGKRRGILDDGAGGKVGLLVLVLRVGGRQACAGVAVVMLSLLIVSPRAMYMSI